MYEASLLLLDDEWEVQYLAIEGNIVVAVPTRDALLFTGTNASEAVQEMRRQVATVTQDAS